MMESNIQYDNPGAVVKRKIYLDPNSEQANCFFEELLALPGCISVIQKNVYVYIVEYNAATMQCCDIEILMRTLNLRLANTFFNRMRWANYRFTDKNAYDNARTPPRPCCSKRPVGR